MGSNLYRVVCSGWIIAERMPLEPALILIKALSVEWCDDPNLKLTIEKVPYGPVEELVKGAFDAYEKKSD